MTLVILPLYAAAMDKPDPSSVDPTPMEGRIDKVKSLLNLVPHVGGVLADLAGQRLAERRNRRLIEFLEAIVADLNAHKDRVNSDFVQRDEFADLFEHVLEDAQSARQKGKLDALRAIFRNTVLSAKPSYDEAAEILHLVARMEARHLVILRILADPLKADAAMGNVVGPGSGGGFSSTSFEQIFSKLLPAWEREQIERTWVELGEWKLHRSGYGGMMSNRGIHQLEGRLTEFGQKVVSYLREG